MGLPRIVKSGDAARTLPELLDLVASGEVIEIIDGRRRTPKIRGYLVGALPDTAAEPELAEVPV